jgi:hypothetical protein
LPLTGTYVLALKSQSSSAISGVVTVSSDNTGTLGAEGTVATFTTTRAGQNGRYTLSGTAGQKLALYVYGLTAGQNYRVDLISPAQQDQQVIASGNSSTPATSAYIQVMTLPATGQYSVFVTPLGIGTSTFNVQYGQPDLTVASFTLGAVSIAQNGSYVIPYTAVVKNQGTVGAKWQPWYDEVYLSTDATLDTTDTSIRYTTSSVDVPAGGTYTINNTGNTSATTPAGSYTVFFKTDGNDSNGTYAASPNILIESDETNNVASAPVTLPTLPDLVPSNLSVGAITVNQNGTYTIPVSYTVTNNGASGATPSWYDYAYLSVDSTLDTTDPFIAYAMRTTTVASGASYTVNLTGSAGAATAAGTYTIFAKTNGWDNGWAYAPGGNLKEADGTNNVISTTVVIPAHPDLTITSGPTVGTIVHNANGSYSIPITFTVTNIGPSTAKASWYDECYLSTDSTLDTTDRVLGYQMRTTDLTAGAQYTVSMTCTTSTTTASGSYTLFVKTDGYDNGSTYSATSELYESNESNNTASATVTLP